MLPSTFSSSQCPTTPLPLVSMAKKMHASALDNTFLLASDGNDIVALYSGGNNKVDVEPSKSAAVAFFVKVGLAQMLRGSVIMDVVAPDQVRVAKEAGVCTVMAVEHVPTDIRAQAMAQRRLGGGVSGRRGGARRWPAAR